MVAANFNAVEWKGLRHNDRAEAVARYRLRKHITLHESEALDVHMRKRSPKK